MLIIPVLTLTQICSVIIPLLSYVNPNLSHSYSTDYPVVIGFTYRLVVIYVYMLYKSPWYPPQKPKQICQSHGARMDIIITEILSFTTKIQIGSEHVEIERTINNKCLLSREKNEHSKMFSCFLRVSESKPQFRKPLEKLFLFDMSTLETQHCIRCLCVGCP